MSYNFIRHPKVLKKDKAALIVIDIQQRIFKVMQDSERVIENSVKLIKGARALGVPVFYTEQYPKGLGETEERVKEALGDLVPMQKMAFSAIEAENLFTQLKEKKIKQVILAGIECHVCMQQTSLDLMANGFDVYLAVDATSSRKQLDRDIALRRMEKHGVELVPTESVLFDLLEVSGTPEFKEISKLVK